MAEVNRVSGTVQSPCVRNCCLDDSDVCIGCHRTIAEITGWSAADNHQRNEILARCRQRREQRNVKKSQVGQ